MNNLATNGKETQTVINRLKTRQILDAGGCEKRSIIKEVLPKQIMNNLHMGWLGLLSQVFLI